MEDIIGDPMIAKSGPSGRGMLTPGWFAIQSASPVRDRGLALIGVTEDFQGAPRGNYPDMGALEVAEGTSITESQGNILRLPLRADLAASVGRGEASLEVSFKGSAGGGKAPYTYLWSFGDGDTSTAQFPSHTYTASGSYQVILTVKDAGSSFATETMKVTVRAAVRVSQLSHNRRAVLRKKIPG